jgi:hypothetical protein
MAAISTRHSEAHSAALRAFQEAKDAERASIPVDDAAWAKKVERRRHDEHWRNDPEWLSHPDHPDRLRPENIKLMDKI